MTPLGRASSPRRRVRAQVRRPLGAGLAAGDLRLLDAPLRRRGGLRLRGHGHRAPRLRHALPRPGEQDQVIAAPRGPSFGPTDWTLASGSKRDDPSIECPLWYSVTVFVFCAGLPQNPGPEAFLRSCKPLNQMG